MQNDQCTSCGTIHYPGRNNNLNDVGHCEECRGLVEHYSLIDEVTTKCINCDKPVDNKKNNMCNECLTLQNSCTNNNCYNTKYVSEYVCNKCKINYMKAGKTYKLQQ
jgi:hypothetical protein